MNKFILSLLFIILIGNLTFIIAKNYQSEGVTVALTNECELNNIQRVNDKDTCIKITYACPDHPDELFLETGPCNETIIDDKGIEKICGKLKTVTQTIHSAVITVYVCKNGHKFTEKLNRCPECKEYLKAKKTCELSGTFPHINEKGFMAWNIKVSHSNLKVETFAGEREPVLKSCSYLLYCPIEKEAGLIDGSCDPAKLAGFIAENKLNLKYIILTHSHKDHFVTLAEIMREFKKAPVLMYIDKIITPPRTGRFNPQQLDDGQYLALGKSFIKIIHTPGHWADCICIWTDKIIFTGDTDFCQSEIAEKLKQNGVPDNAQPYMGHGY